jgi:hypothetical protein
VLGPTGSRPTTPQTNAATADTGFHLVMDSRESAAATAARLRAALDDGLRRAAPDARWLAGNLFGVPTADGEPPAIVTGDGITVSDEIFYGGSFVAVGARKGLLYLQISGPRLCTPNDPKCRADDPQRRRLAHERLLTCQGADNCAERTAPDGRRIITETTSIRPPKLTGPWPITTHHVRIELSAEYVLTLTAGNESDDGGKGLPAQQDPPLSIEQVVVVLVTVAGRIRR